MTWIKDAVKNAADPDTTADLEAILEAAHALTSTDSLSERTAAERRLQHSMALLYRVYAIREPRT